MIRDARRCPGLDFLSVEHVRIFQSGIHYALLTLLRTHLCSTDSYIMSILEMSKKAIWCLWPQLIHCAASHREVAEG